MTLWLVVLIPLAGAALWPAGLRAGRREAPVALRLGAAATVLVTATLGIAVAAALGGWSTTLDWGSGLTLELSAAGVPGIVAVLVPAVAAPVVAYAAAHEPARDLPRLLGLMVAFVGSMQLLVLAADLLTLLIAWELVGALSWALIGVGWRDATNSRRAAHAFNATRFGGVGLFLAAGAALAGAGSLSYATLEELAGADLDVVAGGVLLAAAAKSAQLPFAPWLYSAMAGPTPVSALLHSATMVAAGAYALIRLEEALAPTGWFGPAVVAIGLATALAGGVAAVVEHHGKRVLAASTSAQYGLMFVAVGVGVAGAAVAHLVAHALFKALLFLGVGVGISAVGDADIHRMRLGRALPRSAAAFAVGSLALAAVPPLGAAWTKDALVAAGFHQATWIGALMLVAGFLSGVYATRLHLLAFGRGGQADPAAARVDRPRGVEVVALWLLAAASLALGLLWLPPAADAVERLTGLEIVESEPWELLLAVALLGLAVALVAREVRQIGLANLGLPTRVRAAIADWYGLPTATRVVVVDPFLALCRGLGRFDDTVVDALPRAVATAVRRGSGVLARWGELGVDGAVRLVAGGVVRSAAGSSAADDRGVDGAVEGIAAAVGVSGRATRRLQTGLAHTYYLYLAIGAVAIAVVVAFWR